MNRERRSQKALGKEVEIAALKDELVDIAKSSKTVRPSTYTRLPKNVRSSQSLNLPYGLKFKESEVVPLPRNLEEASSSISKLKEEDPDVLQGFTLDLEVLLGNKKAVPKPVEAEASELSQKAQSASSKSAVRPIRLCPRSLFSCRVACGHLRFASAPMSEASGTEAAREWLGERDRTCLRATVPAVPVVAVPVASPIHW